jgi:hypothetical protein
VEREESSGSRRSATQVEAAVRRITYRDLLARFKDIERWYNNLSRGSKITADVYLRRIGSICGLRGITPVELGERATADERWAYNFLIDLVTEFESRGKAGSYIHSNVKVVKSWLSHNGIKVSGKVKIRGVDDTPSLRGKDALTGSEQRLLISPALHQGVDLKDDLSRFQVILKVPYPDLSDRRTQMMLQRDRTWYAWQTAQRLVQTYGRSIRSETDHAVTYVLDSNFTRFVTENRNLFPKYFVEAIEEG